MPLPGRREMWREIRRERREAPGPGRRRSIDYKSMPPSRTGLDNLLVIIDAFSSDVVLVPCPKEVHGRKHVGTVPNSTD